MSDEQNSGPNETGPLIAILWLLVGLAPVAILLVLVSSPRQRPDLGLALIICAACNLVGGIGCLRGVKNTSKRIVLGILLGGFFFVLSWVIAIFQACSHMNI